MKQTVIYPLLFCFLFLTGCADQLTQSQHHKENSITRVISGRVEAPDTLLQKVLELEEAGLLSKVSIVETFPVQIQLTGSADVVHALETLSQVP